MKYQGEAINKLYIDGVDMLGDRYGLATENISPRDVKSVDVMENHQPKKVLRDIEFSDKAALNIRMDARVRNRWTGSAEVGAGFSPVLWSGSLFAMCMAKSYSVMQTVKSDNTGLTSAPRPPFWGCRAAATTLCPICRSRHLGGPDRSRTHPIQHLASL